MGREAPWQLIALALVLALVGAGFAAQTDRFLDPANFANILLQASAVATAAIGMTFVIATRGIDLSAGSVMNLALVLGVLLGGTRSEERIAHDTSLLVYPVALLAGAGLGALNAVLIDRLRLNPLIATLGTLTLYRGVALHLTGATEIIVLGDLQLFGRAVVPGTGLGLPVLVMALIALCAAVVLARTPAGRTVLAIGGSPRSARETGLPVRRTLLWVYALSGLTAALAGLVLVGRIGGLNPDLGWNFEFTVITAVVLGGTSLFGGRASVAGAVLGAVLLATIQNGLNLIAADPFVYDVVRGLILVAAVSADAAASRLRRRGGVAAAAPGAA